MSDDASWYNQGYDGMKKEEDRISTMGGPNRIWIKPGTSCDFVFVDDEPVCIYEHNPKIDGSFRNWITCVKGIYDEAICCDEMGEKTRYYVGYYTVVDCSKWTDKKGNTYQYEVKFLPAKLKTLKKFKRKKEDRIAAGAGGLAGCLYKATREDEKSPNVGDEFEFTRTVDMEKLFQVANYKGKKLSDLFAKASDQPNQDRLRKIFNIKVGADGKVVNEIPAFSYMDLLRPKSMKDLKEALKNVEEKDPSPGGSNTPSTKSSGPSGADNDVPF